MSTTLKIPMNEETRIALEDCFIDEGMDARKFIFGQIKLACQDAKRSLRNKITATNQRQEDGSMKQQEYKLKGVNLEKFTLSSNPDWVPKNMDSEDNTPIELKLGDNTMGYIKSFGQIVLVRHEQYNMAEEKFIEHTKSEMEKANAPEENVKQWEKAQEKIRKERLAAVPTCIEEAIFVSIWPIIQQKIDQNDGKIFDKEWDDENTPKEPEKPAGQ